MLICKNLPPKGDPVGLVRMYARDRQREAESCAFTGDALNPDAAAVRFDSQFAKGQPDAGAVTMPFRRLNEQLKDQLLIFFRHAGTLILNFDHDPVTARMVVG